MPNTTAPGLSGEGTPPPGPQRSGHDAGVVAEGLSRTFGAVQAVRHIDFVARPGEVTALIGPNGSGKTTLLLMLASLLRPDTGSVRIGSVDVAADPRAARELIGWMPDTLGVWETLTSREILTSMGRLYGMEKASAAARADELLELVKLTELSGQPSRVLSRGQQQRLSLARALMNDPQVLLLDEPASGLDPGARIDLRNLLRRFAAEGRTVVVSSHVLSELDEIADAAVFVAAGSSVRTQTLAEADTQTRRYSVRGLDHTALLEALNQQGIAYTVPAAQRRTEALIDVASEAEAATVLRALVEAGVAVAAFAPTVGALEETYMSSVYAQESGGIGTASADAKDGRDQA
ncbi:ABC-type multidrug transport system ATPase subunit [Zhihengliuella flava]|uniref:ABC-type multidrug transport system ATPase subunit n=1 Tax=Zhihengliuella flava TaxID=1285193 RepID=A0A931DCS3_9MICC|nr:ABC-type multidrug transport system ATPase subunit [Zhihengliuella flava]